MANDRDDYNKGGLIAFVGSIVFCLVFFIYISFFHAGIDLKEVSEVQTGSGPVFDITKVEKPWVESPEMIAYGKKVFKGSLCVTCHGEKGMGDGPGGAALNPKPRNFVEGQWKRGGTSIDLFTTLEEGLPGTAMVSFKASYSKADRWALVQFIRSITKNKPADDAAKTDAFAAKAD